jgi:hypothetical protein
MSSPILPTGSRSQSSDLQDEVILSARSQDRDELATRIEQQGAKIRALKLAVEERRRAELRLQERAQRAVSRRQRYTITTAFYGDKYRR